MFNHVVAQQSVIPGGIIMQGSLISQSLDLMLFGMGTVFLFLLLLIGVTTLISRIILRFFPDQPMVGKPEGARIPAPAGLDPLTLKVIKAALDQYRARR
jgi:oxaloacetate decarboxylase gamma subunit